MDRSILICASAQCASSDELHALTTTAHDQLRILGIRCQVFQVKCLELCQRGPHVVIHGARGHVPEEARSPDGGVAYDQMTAQDLTRVISEHLVGGAPLTEKLHRDQPGRR